MLTLNTDFSEDYPGANGRAEAQLTFYSRKPTAAKLQKQKLAFKTLARPGSGGAHL